MPAEQAAKLPLANLEPIGERRDIALVERPALDQFHSSRHGRFRAAPGIEIRRTLGPAAQARAKSGLLGRGGGWHEDAILELRRTGRTNRPAIDAGRFHAREKPPVVAGIAGLDRAVTNCRVKLHNVNYRDLNEVVSRFSDLNGM